MVRSLDYIRAKSSGLITDDSAVIFAKPCWYLGATIVQGQGLQLTTKFTVYDNATEAAGTEIDYFRCSDEEELNICHILEEPKWCANGIFAGSVEQMYSTGWLVWYAY